MNHRIEISADHRLGSCPHFWQAAGDDEAYEWTLHPTGEALLSEIKRTKCISWMRNHHALSREIPMPDGRKVLAYREDSSGRPIHDFSGMDAVYDRWLAAGIRPIVELDFLPAELRDERKFPRNTPEMWEKWGGLMRAFVRHLQERYGVEETRQWYFENWNEPDLWPRERLGEYFRLHDEAVAAVESVDPQLRIGGPATAAQPMCDTFLQQVTFGQNQLTGEKGSRYDFLSMHQYGVSGNTLLYSPALVPRPQTVAMAAYWLYDLIKVFPGAREKEFHFNEWGMISHYEKTAYEFPPLEIRNTEFFPLFMIKLVHILFTLSDYRGGWLPRILLLWAGAVEPYYAAIPEYRQRVFKGRSGLFAGNRSLTTLYNLAKPILRGFELMTSLGAERLAVQGAACGDFVSALATHGDGAIRILLYHFDEAPAGERPPAQIDLVINDLSVDGSAELTVTRLDRAHANTFRAWEKLGRPEELTDEQLRIVSEAGELHPEPVLPMTVRDGSVRISLDLPCQGAAMLVLRPKNGDYASPQKEAEKSSVSWRMA